jgi:hypothetical protein
MRAEPVVPSVVLLIRDCLTSQLTLTIGVRTTRGQLVEHAYQVTNLRPDSVDLVKENGEVRMVEWRFDELCRPFLHCSCQDRLYRDRRDDKGKRQPCKHGLAVELAGLLAPGVSLAAG